MCLSISTDKRIAVQTKWYIEMLESMQDVEELLNQFVVRVTYLKAHLYESG